MTARLTTLDDNKRAALLLDRDRLHHTETLGLTITRIDVDMLRPQANWTMVGVPCPGYRSAAMFARKILDRARELFGHWCDKPPLFLIVLNCQ